MAANPSILPHSHPRQELVPYVHESPTPSEETEGLTLAANLLGAINFEVTAINFEVAAALKLSPAWHADPHAGVYMVRTLERIAVHMKSLQDIQAFVEAGRDEKSHPDPYVIIRTK